VEAHSAPPPFFYPCLSVRRSLDLGHPFGIR
jgi:hypothetical protein